MPSTTIVQVGCGYWGPNLIRNLLKIPSCHLKAAVEPNPTRREYLHRTFNLSSISWQQALEDPKTEALIIATPAHTHYPLVKEALEAEKHVFVEKPLATSYAEAKELKEIAEKQKKILMVGHTFLYHPAVRYIKKLLQQKTLGSLYYIYCQRLNLGQVRSDVNVWWNLAPHDLSILLYWLEDTMPCEISGSGACYLQPQLEDTVFMNLKWPSLLAHLHLSWLDPLKVRKITLVGSKKMIIYDDMAHYKVMILDKRIEKIPKIGEQMDYDKQISFYPKSGSIFMPAISQEEPLYLELLHFIECIQKNIPPLTGPTHALKVVHILEEGQKALTHPTTHPQREIPTLSFPTEKR